MCKDSNNATEGKTPLAHPVNDEYRSEGDHFRKQTVLFAHRGPEHPDLEKRILEAIEYLSEPEKEQIMLAYHFANYFHAEDRRKSGEAYIYHPGEIAISAAKDHLDGLSVVSSLLHDVYEDHGDRVTLADIGRIFGERVAYIVDGLTKIRKASSKNRTVIGHELAAEAKEAEGKDIDLIEKEKKDQAKKVIKAGTIRKMVNSMSKDLHVIVVKLLDRLHNMLTLDGHGNEAAQKRISTETLEIFCPMATRLGVWNIKAQLEDLSFKYIEPKRYQELESQVKVQRTARQNRLQRTMDKLKEALAELGDGVKIASKPKHLYSIHRELKRSGRKLPELTDMDAIIITVPNSHQCYQALGLVHHVFVPWKDRLRDYFATPKTNMYSALHTTISGADGLGVDVQISTEAQAMVNEWGLFTMFMAGSEANLDAVEKQNRSEKFRNWVGSLLATSDESTGDLDYFDQLRGALSNIIVAFTPDGEAIDLPLGSCPLDFAYAVHSEVGHSCISATVNGSNVSLLTYEIQPNDVVQIQSSKSATPRREWYKYCRSNQARNQIKQWFVKGSPDLNIEAGKRLTDVELTKLNLHHLSDDQTFMANVGRRLGYEKVNDMLFNLGCWKESAERFSNAVRLEARKGSYFAGSKCADLVDGKRSLIDMIEVVGLKPEEYQLKWTRCCSAVVGDNLIGYMANNKQIRVHRSDCQTAAELRRKSPERFVTLRWDKDVIDAFEDKSARNKVGICLKCRSRDTMLGDVLRSFDRASEHICEEHYVEDCNREFAEMKIFFDAANQDQVNDFMDRLRKIEGVLRVYRQ